MIKLDMIGLLVTIVIAGPFHIIGAVFLSVLQEVMRLAIIMFIDGNIRDVIIGGVFGTTTFDGIHSRVASVVIVLTGPVSILILALLSAISEDRGGTVVTGRFRRALRSCKAVGLRLALFSGIFSVWQAIRFIAPSSRF